MKKPAGILLLAMMFFMIQTGCKKDSNSESSVSSTAGSSRSHNSGAACMNCHSSGGSGDGVWKVAGTVYNQAGTAVNPNATVYLYSGINGTGNLLATLEVDTRGNFYTSANIFPASGCYPQVKGSSGNIQNMGEKCNSGNCNSCHGITTGKIWVN